MKSIMMPQYSPYPTHMPTRRPHCETIPLSYDAALTKLEESGRLLSTEVTAHERKALAEALGRVAAEDIHSPIATPEHDTSAMDGYAIRSAATLDATPDSPVIFEIMGTIAAGDADKPPDIFLTDGVHNGAWVPCLEIMTGGRFPEHGDLDACVKVEDVNVVGPGQSFPGKGSRVMVTKPVARHCNRRFAGDDIACGELLLEKGQLINAACIMPLASVGINSVLVARKPRIGIWSTGKEMGPGCAPIRDVNGVHLEMACRELGAEPVFFGVLDDDLEVIASSINKKVESGDVDVLITSGGISAGKFDLVRKALDLIGATIVFHGLNIRPGHPVLFANMSSIRQGDKRVAFFGLPGNPGAAAACFRFLCVPILRQLAGQPPEQPVLARQLSNKGEFVVADGKCDRDVFCLGKLVTFTPDTNSVFVTEKRPSSHVGQFATANCWVHLGPYQSTQPGMVRCFPWQCSC